MRGALRCHWVYLFKVMVDRGSSPGRRGLCYTCGAVGPQRSACEATQPIALQPNSDEQCADFCVQRRDGTVVGLSRNATAKASSPQEAACRRQDTSRTLRAWRHPGTLAFLHVTSAHRECVEMRRRARITTLTPVAEASCRQSCRKACRQFCRKSVRQSHLGRGGGRTSFERCHKVLQ